MKLTKIHTLVMKAPTGKLSLYQILRPLKLAFKPYPWIRLESRSIPVPTIKNALSISGRFEPDYCGRVLCVVTVTNFAEASRGKILFTDRMRDRVLFDIFATIAHERIHLLQSHKAKACPRPYRVHHSDNQIKKDQEYYGATNEIDAYGFTSALEEVHGVHGDILERYRKIFSPDDFRFKRFLKKKYKWSLTLPAL